MRGEPLTFPASPGSDPEAQGGPGGQENEGPGEIQLGGSTHSEQTATGGGGQPYLLTFLKIWDLSFHFLS